jgi:glycosyltransferase involved in cell wall biosynthesis
MKVLFITCLQSPYDHNAGSGKDYDLFQGLLRNDVEVRVVGPFPFSQNLLEKVFRKAQALLFSKRPIKYPVSFLNNAAKQAMIAIEQFQPDVVFSKHVMIVSRLKTQVPIVVLSDTTLYGSEQDWPTFSRMAYWRQERWEQKAYQMASKIILQSQWSADIMTQHYNQPSEKVRVIPAPASIPVSVVPEMISPPELSPLKILLVGRDYHRKGIDIAMEVVRQLNQHGNRAYLRIVGLDGDSSEQIRFMGLYNKTIPDQLEGYAANYRWANFLIHPARFEGAGIVPAEAAAFGVPTITNDVGGLGTTVVDGVSGVVLPKHSPPEAYVTVLERFVHAEDEYISLCQRTRERYEKELNWESASRRVVEILSMTAKQQA